MHDDDNVVGPNGAHDATTWAWIAAVCCAVLMLLALVTRAAAALLRDSGSPAGLESLGDWRQRMRAVRFRQQLAHWAAGNSAFRAGQRGSRASKSDDVDSMV